MLLISHIKPVGYGFGININIRRPLIYSEKFSSKYKIALNFAVKKFNFIDTAAEYGNGESEKLIGKLPSLVKKKIFISTKVSSHNLNYKDFIKSALLSLERLKVNKIDLIQPHWPNYQVENDEIIFAFKYLKKKGYVRYFGLSNYDFIDIKYFKKKIKSDFRFIQEEYSLNDRSIEDKKISFCEQNDIKIICYSPLSSGNLILSNLQKTLLKKISEKFQVSISSVILNYLLTKSKNLILIPHSINLQNISSNCAVLDYKLSSNDILMINNEFKIKTIKIKLRNIIYPYKGYSKKKKLEAAIKNEFNFTPSPYELSKKIISGCELKNIKVEKINKDYYLVEGRLRFWAYVLAYGWNYSINVILKN